MFIEGIFLQGTFENEMDVLSVGTLEKRSTDTTKHCR